MTNDSSPPFIHLRVKSAYSLAEGAIRLKDLVKLSAGLDMPAVALTDRGNLFGALARPLLFHGRLHLTHERPTNFA